MDLKPEKTPVTQRDSRFSRIYTSNIEVSDAYHWLEHSNLDETKDFIQQQTDFTSNLIEFPGKAALHEKMREWWSFPKESPPFKAGERYYQLKNNGVEEQDVMYTNQNLEELHSSLDIFLDPNKFSSDGKRILHSFSFSPNGLYMAYALSNYGSGWLEVWFRDVDKRKDYKDLLKKVRYSKLAWSHDSLGIFYSAYTKYYESLNGDDNAKITEHVLLYHIMGTKQKEDKVIFEPPSKTSRVSAEISHNGVYLMVFTTNNTTDNSLFLGYVKQILSSKYEQNHLLKVMDEDKCNLTYVADYEKCLIFFTNHQAERGRLVSIDPHNANVAHWRTIVDEEDEDVLVSAKATARKRLLLLYMKNVRHSLVVYDMPTKKVLKEINLGLGAITNITASTEQSEAFFVYSTPVEPGTIHKLICSNPNIPGSVYKEFKIKNQLPTNFIVKQVYIHGKSGKFPICIVHKKDTQYDGKHPLLMTAYGSLGRCFVYKFSVHNFFFVNYFDGIFVLVNLRGGGEYGKVWHEQGKRSSKPAIVDDFIEAAKYCINQKLTSANNLILHGRGFGALLVAASCVKAPHLFAAAILIDGMYDLLNYDNHTVGYSYLQEIGDPNSHEDHELLRRFSPYHCVHTPDAKIQYPAILIIVNANNDKFPGFHGYKFAAELQRNVTNKQPTLLYVIKNEGQFYHKKLHKRIDLYTNINAFLLKIFHLSYHS